MDNFYGKLNVIFEDRKGRKINMVSDYTEKMKDLIKRYKCKSNVSDRAIYLFNGTKIDKESEQSVISFFKNNFLIAIIIVIEELNINYSLGDIRFIKSKQKCKKKYYGELQGVLKLCLLKQISSKLDDYHLEQLPKKISFIISFLKKREDINAKFIENQELKDDIKNEIKEFLKKIEGMNVITFSKYLDESINESQIEQIKNLLNPDDLEDIEDIKNRLGQFDEETKKFEEELEKAKRESIFEFSVTSIIIMERDDLFLFEKERENCPNREDRILYHGTNPEPIAEILTNFFKIGRCNQHGSGIYFTDQLDYCWFYGGKTNRENVDKIPKINNEDEDFTMIASSIFYNKKKLNRVKDHLYDPKKNEINFAYADANLDTLIELDEKKFYGTEYVIKEFSQICPFISLKLKRNEYCVIWRDPNFSSKAIYGNEFDEKFKHFLKERKKYVNQMAKFNVYVCETTEEALKLVKRKKYNKIILISNIGTDFGGIKFVNEARKIIGNEVIVLFNAFLTDHLYRVSHIKNALFSNVGSFYENYLDCFSSDEEKTKENIKNLKISMEEYYCFNYNFRFRFNFDDKFLWFPNFKDEGKYSELTF